MRVEIVRGGGIAGISTTTWLQSGSLPPADAQELEAKVRSSSLLSDPVPPPTAPSHADELLYEVTVADGEEQRTHCFSEASMPDAVRSLVEWVDARAERP